MRNNIDLLPDFLTLIEEAGAQLVISGHKHDYRYDAQTGRRTWVQLVGGAPHIKYATIIRGRATAKQLAVVMYHRMAKSWTRGLTSPGPFRAWPLR